MLCFGGVFLAQEDRVESDRSRFIVDDPLFFVIKREVRDLNGGVPFRCESVFQGGSFINRDRRDDKIIHRRFGAAVFVLVYRLVRFLEVLGLLDIMDRDRDSALVFDGDIVIFKRIRRLGRHCCKS